MNVDLTFIVMILAIALGTNRCFSYLYHRKRQPLHLAIKNIAGSWVWMLSILFTAYWFGEMTTAILIVLIGIKGLHEISQLKHHAIKSLNKDAITNKDAINKDMAIKRSVNHLQMPPNDRFLMGTKTLTALAFTLIAILIVMTASWLVLNHRLTLQNDRPLMLFMLFVVQFNDVNQYITGKLLGNKLFSRKLAVTISPHKTIEGAVFGTLMTGILSVPIGSLLTRFLPVQCFMIALIMGICGVAGDLLQSAVKRQYGVKDMGSWINGHGGIIDRVDSLLIAVPMFTLLYVYLG